MTEIVVSYEGGLRCRSEHGDSGAVVFTDAPKDHHGRGEGFSPSELLSVSLGSCVLTIMEIAARSITAEIAGATATLAKEMANNPRRIAGISVVVCIPGAFDKNQQRKLEAAAHACPVHKALGIDVPIVIKWTG